MTQSKPKLMIIDGNALIHRSFHALPPTMTTKSGEMVNAVYGFTSVMLKAIRELKPEYVVLTLDKKGPTFRHKKFKDYKAKRIKAPDELYMQIPKVKKLAQAFDIPIFEQAGYEADDLIGTIVNKVGKEVEKIIITGDIDLFQLINPSVKVYKMGRGIMDSKIFGRGDVKGAYGFTPEQVIDYKAIAGDSSDNIPGVRGIGAIGAKKLLEEFKDLDGIYKNIDSEKISERNRKLLQENKKEAYLSYELATIKCDVKIDFNLEATRLRTFDRALIIKLFSEFEFKSLLPRVHTMLDSQAQSREAKQEKTEDKFARDKKKFKYTLVDTEAKFKKLLVELKKQSRGLGITFDTETSGLDPLTADLLGISFSWKKGEAYYLKIKNEELRIKPTVAKAMAGENEESNLFNYKLQNRQSAIGNRQSPHPWVKKLRPIFENKDIKKYAHNAKFDIRVMGSAGIEVRGLAFDSMIASYLLNPGTRQHNLDALTFSELGFEKITKDDLLGKGRDRISFSQVDINKLSLYSCEDADFTNRLVLKLKKQLKEQKLDNLFKDIEMPLIGVLIEMENNGIIIDKEFLAKMSKKLAKKLKQLEAKIHKLAGIIFNISSIQQLREVLFTRLAIPSDNISRTKTGLSTAADELAKLKDLHPIIKLIQEYRELTKLTSTYINALPELINPLTGRVHTNFNQAVTATGRLSSSEPNLQNIPIRTKLGREIRKAFTVAKGYKLVSLDYSQIELRLAAHMSGDKKMIKAFQHGADIHTSTAAEINQISPEAVDKESRREAKAINFGILYGQGPHGLSQGADIPYARAREFIEQYFIVYKDIKKFIDLSIDIAKEKGYAETMFHRRRYLPDINSSVAQVRKAAERMAINMPLQGTAADMIKVAMIEVYKQMAADNYGADARMLLQVHDELLFEVKDELVESATEKIKNIMENIIKLKVPVIVDVSVGENWGEMEEVKS